MIKKIDFERMDKLWKIERISSILNEFESEQIIQLREFWDIRKNYLSDDVLMNVYNILRSQHQSFVNISASIMSEYISNIKKQEQGENLQNNPEDILNTI